MRLNSIWFREHHSTHREWTLEEAGFDSVNLVVGRNASGKSRTLNVINGLSVLIAGLQKPLWDSAEYSVIFEGDGKKYQYDFSIDERLVTSESLSIDGENVLERGRDGIGSIKAEALNLNFPFQAPPSELAVVVRRDTIQHPFLEPLHSWAKSVRRYPFGSELGKSQLYASGIAEHSAAEQSAVPATNPELVVALFDAATRRFGGDFHKGVLRDFARIGYPCSEVGVRAFEGLKLPNAIPLLLYVQENDLPCPTTQIEMSMGMYRALALIIHLNYSLLSGEASCILIDDIGEGLDYERSVQLIELLQAKCDNSNIQLLMTTNDRFVMNSIPLEAWRVVHRQSNVVKILDHNNSKSAFEEFKYLGLTNFDFFTSKAYLGQVGGEEVSDIR